MTSFINSILCPVSNLHIPIASGDVAEVIAGNKKCYVSFSALRNFLHKIGMSVPPIPQKLRMRVFDFGEWAKENNLDPNCRKKVVQRLFR